MFTTISPLVWHCVILTHAIEQRSSVANVCITSSDSVLRAGQWIEFEADHVEERPPTRKIGLWYIPWNILRAAPVYGPQKESG